MTGLLELAAAFSAGVLGGLMLGRTTEAQEAAEASAYIEGIQVGKALSSATNSESSPT